MSYHTFKVPPLEGLTPEVIQKASSLLLRTSSGGLQSSSTSNSSRLEQQQQPTYVTSTSSVAQQSEDEADEQPENLSKDGTVVGRSTASASSGHVNKDSSPSSYRLLPEILMPPPPAPRNVLPSVT